MTDPAPPSDDTLSAALQRYDIQLPDVQVARLDRYCRLLWQWNEKLNLTRHTTFDKFVARDLVDSLQLAALLEPEEDLLDLGTGGGVPGVVLAIVRPDLAVSLCESVVKRATAVGRIVDELGLSVPIFPERLEKMLDGRRFSTVVARAVGRLDKILRWVEPHWGSVGQLLLVKGPRWVEERGKARHLGLLRRIELRCVASYPMPGTESESVVLRLRLKQNEKGVA